MMIRIIVFCLVSIVTASCGQSSKAIKIMSFNVRYGTADDGENSWENRKDAAAEMILDQKPALFGVQEALDFQIEDILERCPAYKCVGVGREDGLLSGEHLSVFYDTGRLVLKDWGTYWLSETPDVPSKGWDAKCKRTATWLLLYDTKAGESFYIVNTHLDHKGVEARVMGLGLITGRIGSMNTENRPMILMGDMNVHPGNPSLDVLRPIMHDAWTNAKKTNPGPTWHDFGKKNEGTPIDYIFYSGFNKCECMLRIQKSYGGVPFVSDHYPVMAVLRYR